MAFLANQMRIILAIRDYAYYGVQMVHSRSMYGFARACVLMQALMSKYQNESSKSILVLNIYCMSLRSEWLEGRKSVTDEIA